MDHHVFRRNDIEEMINLQQVGSKAKPYQVRNLIIKYKLGDSQLRTTKIQFVLVVFSTLELGVRLLEETGIDS